MNLTINDVKVHKMSKDDRLLYDAGIIDIDGKPTTSGWEILKGIVLTDYKEKLIALVKEINAEKEQE